MRFSPNPKMETKEIKKLRRNLKVIILKKLLLKMLPWVMLTLKSEPRPRGLFSHFVKDREKKKLRYLFYQVLIP